MSNLLEQASLVMIPSGYKEDVVYSQIPLDGSGDLTLTRASNGTRVNSAGLVEVCPWNLAEQSETFNVSPWTAINVGITTNATTAPNGTTTAEKLMVTTANTPHQVQQGFNNDNANHTVFIYAKKSELNFVQLALGNSIEQYANFNLNTGVVGTKGTDCASSSIESVGNGWYKCSAYFNQGTIPSLMVYVTNSASSNWGGIVSFSGANNTDGIFVWGYQLNIGATAKPYFPTTDRLNVPRLTYQNGGGGCPSLLLEKQSTNLYFPSTPNNSASGTYVANAGISPDGTQNAASFTASGYSVLYSNTVTTTVQSYTWSLYLKGTVNGQKVRLGTDVATITDLTLTTEWARYSVTFTGTASTYGYYILAGSYFSPAQNNLFYVWGSQIEASSYATSLILTTSSSVTRVADACFKTGISSLIGQTEGVLFVDAKNLYPSGARTIGLLFTSGSAFYQMYINSSNEVRVDVNGSFLFLGGTIAQNTQYKIAFAYKSGSNALYINGTQIATSTSTTIPSSLADFYVGNSLSSEQSGSINQAILFPTRLTNAELASLTTI